MLGIWKVEAECIELDGVKIGDSRRDVVSIVPHSMGGHTNKDALLQDNQSTVMLTNDT